MRIIVVLLSLVVVSACSVALQPSVRSASVGCSPSYAFAVVDAGLAAGLGYWASRGADRDPAPGYVMPTEISAGVLGASALLGAYKAHHCARYRETAPPEVWAAYAAEQQRAAAEAELTRQQLAQQQAVAQVEVAQAEPEQEPAASNVTVNRTSNTQINSTSNIESRTDMRVVNVPAPQAQITNAAYHAIYRRSPTAGATCEAFAADPFGRPGDNMAACSRFCTPWLKARQACQCDPGACR